MRPTLRLGIGVAMIGAGAVALARPSTAPPTSNPPSIAAPAARNPGATRTRKTASRAQPMPNATTARSTRLVPIFSAAWGSALGELGRTAVHESAPIGPMSFVVDDEGRIHVLDQANRRIEVFEGGTATKAVPLVAESFDDVVLFHGGYALLDRATAASVQLVDANGKVDREIALAGRNVPEPGLVTGLFSRPDGLWVEVEHDVLVRLADASGNDDPTRTTVPGRFSSDGSARLRAVVNDGATITVERTSGGTTTSSHVAFADPLLGLGALEADASHTFLLASTFEEGPPPDFATLGTRTFVVVLDSAGVETARIDLPPKEGPEEQLRAMRLGADGNLYHLALDAQGATLRKVVTP